MAGMQTEDRPRHWIFSSSGARPLYLENIVRVLGLPAREVVKFRYEADIVAGTFKNLVGTGVAFTSSPVVGDTVYLSYLDNRDKLTQPHVYPVREATIRSVSVLGTTYVIQLKLQDFMDWTVDNQLDQTIAACAIDPLPGWGPIGETDPAKIDYTGYWVAATKPLPDAVFHRYSASTRSHLKAFESSVKAISRGTDFSDDKRLFVTILGLYDSIRKTPIENGPLRAGRTYDLYLYHYQPGDNTHNPLENFRLKASIDNDDVAIVGAAERHIEARYDEVVLPFRVKEDAKDGVVNLGVDVQRFDNGASEPIYVLRGSILRRVQSSRLRKLGFGLLIGLGLFGTQAVTLFATDELSILTFVLALAFSLLAGIGAAFQFKTNV